MSNLKVIRYNKMEAAGGLRVKGKYGGSEIYLGNHQMGSGGANRVESNYDAVQNEGNIAVSLSYDASQNQLTGKVDS